MRVTPLLAAVVLGLLGVPAAATADDVAAGPHGPNPYLSWLPDPSQADYAGWRKYLTEQTETRRSTVDRSAPVVHEGSGPNDTLAEAQPLPNFGTGAGAGNVARILGSLAPDAADVDVYRFDLRAGDVFAAQVTGAGRQLAIFDPAGVQMQGSAQDFSALYPASSPLPRGGNAIADHVASVGGTHYLAVSDGDGDYEVAVQAHRPPLERERVPQVVFLDFDGAQVDMGIFDVEPSPGVRTLSPFSTFLSGWGLSTADEPALVRQIVRTVRENLAEDVAAHGNNPTTRLLVLNSFDHPDLFGRENVSRVVVGGATTEAGFTTVGIAQSIDPGNFANEETALVMQDFLSQPAGPAVSLNTYLGPQSDRIAFIGRAIGNVVAHEIGHYIGSWHTDNTNTTVNLMDAGGAGIPGFFGVGPDGVGGTADDTDTDLTTDVFRPLEGFTGVEDSLNRSAFGLSGFRRGA
ncbi:hypothetical protein [Actinophytocola sp.]|uniref:hypothetical protein n=1 Tax=Actinophytocola sp. TaxID=1872138 RepID=UPI002ED2371E